MDKFELNDQEKILVEAFYKNEVQREAVRKILLFGVYSNGVIKSGGKHNPLMNWALALSRDIDLASNEKLGENLRAVTEGIRCVENAFNEMSKFQTVEPEVKPKKHPGR